MTPRPRIDPVTKSRTIVCGFVQLVVLMAHASFCARHHDVPRADLSSVPEHALCSRDRRRLHEGCAPRRSTRLPPARLTHGFKPDPWREAAREGPYGIRT